MKRGLDAAKNSYPGWFLRLLLLTFAAVALAACVSTRPQRPAGADVNLSGFPPEFKQGYADGCSSARDRRVRDDARYREDAQYAAGWRDGFDICRRK